MKRYVVPTLLLLALSACGGGGGGSSTSAGGGTVTPPVVPQAKVQTVSVQRAIASDTLSGAQTTKEAYGFGGGGSTTFSPVRRVMNTVTARLFAAYRPGMRITSSNPVRATSVVFGPCTNGTETYSNQVSANEVQVYGRAFYDIACTRLYQDIYLDVTSTSSSAASATGTATQYNQSGVVFAYNTLAISLSQGTTSTFSLYITDALNVGSPQIAAIGVACTVTGTTSFGCGAGAVAHSASASADGAATVSMGASVSSPGTVSVTGNASAFSGSLNTLSLAAGTFPAWNVTGGSLVDSASLVGSLTFNNVGLITGGTMTVADSADDGTAVLTASGTTLTGVIKQTSTGATVATFAVDQNGNGTLSYSSGATGQIADWQVIG